MSFTVVFEQATFDFDLSRADEAFQFIQEGKPKERLKLPGPDGYQAEIDYFLNCIRTKQSPQVVTVHDALTAVRICEAEEASIQSKTPMAVV